MTQSMLPSAPKDVGIIPDVFISALGSIVGGEYNRLKLPRVASAILIMVDGLGLENLTPNLAYARNLRALIASEKIPSFRVGFPATTAVSLTSLGTGLRAPLHGITGYSVADCSLSPVNMLSGWGEGVVPEAWQPNETIAELASQVGVTAYFVGPGEYEGSGFTSVFMRGTKYVAAESIVDRLTAAVALSARPYSLVYCYIPELDKAAHRFGSESVQWLQALEEFDSALQALKGAKAGVLITADHGVVDVSSSDHVYLEQVPGYAAAASLTLGDPRVAYAYGDEAAIREAVSAVPGVISANHYELVTAGWCMEHVGLSRKPDLYLIATGSVALYDRRTASAQSMRMIGQHGALDDLEQRVPLIKLCGYS